MVAPFSAAIAPCFIYIIVEWVVFPGVVSHSEWLSSPVSIQTQSLALRALRKRKPQETQALFHATNASASHRNARSKQWQPWLAACQRKRLRFLRFSFTQRTQRKRLRLDGNRAWVSELFSYLYARWFYSELFFDFMSCCESVIIVLHCLHCFHLSDESELHGLIGWKATELTDRFTIVDKPATSVCRPVRFLIRRS